MRSAERLLLALLLALTAAPSAAGDWLAEAEAKARAAELPGPPPETPKGDWIPFMPKSRLFAGDIPAKGWWPVEEETATGTVFRLIGPDNAEGTFRASLSVRFIDKDSPRFVPIKQAVERMRRDEKETRRKSTPVRPVRIGLGLARTFEVVETRRLPAEEGPSFDTELHHYVAVVPVGEAYYVIRLITNRADYLDYREDFVKFLKSLRAISGR